MALVLVFRNLVRLQLIAYLNALIQQFLKKFPELCIKNADTPLTSPLVLQRQRGRINSGDQLSNLQLDNTML